MSESFDRLDLELRCLPGVLSVGVAVPVDADTGEPDEAGTLVLQVVVRAADAPPGVRDQIRRIVRANVDQPMVLEVLVEGSFADEPTILSRETDR